MDTATIREAVLHRPFRPFRLRLNDGKEYLVPQPEYVAVSSRVVALIDPVTEAGIELDPQSIASMQVET
jgi:hypothetical protein